MGDDDTRVYSEALKFVNVEDLKKAPQYELDNIDENTVRSLVA